MFGKRGDRAARARPFGARLGSEGQDDRAVRSLYYPAQRLCRLLERKDGCHRHAKGATGKQLREGRQLPTVGADVDVGHDDAAFLPRRVARDRREAAAVGDSLQRGRRLPAGSVAGPWGPMATTVPAASVPSAIGAGPPTRQLPILTSSSQLPTPAAATSIKTSSAAGGPNSSTSRISTGSPSALIPAARIPFDARYWRR